jgi:hypothetical protein
MSDLTLEQEYTILSENGGTLATWEQFKQDWEEVVNYHHSQSLEQLEKKYYSSQVVGSRLLNYGTLLINGVATVTCPLYAPVGVVVQVVVYKLNKLSM